MFHIFIICLLPAAALSQCSISDGKKTEGLNAASESLYKGQQHFSLQLLKTLVRDYKEKNVFVSPHSIYQSLMLAYLISANETEAVLQRSLGLPAEQTKLSTIQAFVSERSFQEMREMHGPVDYEFKSANRLFLSNKLKAKDCMKELLNNDLESVDFETDPGAARELINKWVEDATKQHIKDLLPADAVHTESQLILANAAYFKGLWKSKFLPEHTKKNDIFYIAADELRHVEMMKQKGTFNLMKDEKLQAHMLELPYKGESVSMFILLPRLETNAIDKLVKLLEFETLTSLLSGEGFSTQSVEVKIPKFSVEQSLELVPVLETLGLADMFNESADFSALTSDADIHFNDAVHKAKLEVDEDGTVAAAATAIFTFRSSRPLEPARFIANHPFVYFIYDKVSKNVLFMGVFRRPDKRYPKKT